MQYELFGWDLYGNPVTAEQNTDREFMGHKSFWSSEVSEKAEFCGMAQAPLDTRCPKVRRWTHPWQLPFRFVQQVNKA